MVRGPYEQRASSALRQGGRRARWLLRDGAVQRQPALQRVAKIGILERGRSLAVDLRPWCWEVMPGETQRERYRSFELI